MTLLYFAWVKEKVGVSEEHLSPPPEADTVAKLVAWLATRSAGHAAAFANPKLVKAAVDQVHAPLDSPIAGAREIAFFPAGDGRLTCSFEMRATNVPDNFNAIIGTINSLWALNPQTKIVLTCHRFR